MHGQVRRLRCRKMGGNGLSDDPSRCLGRRRGTSRGVGRCTYYLAKQRSRQARRVLLHYCLPIDVVPIYHVVRHRRVRQHGYPHAFFAVYVFLRVLSRHVRCLQNISYSQRFKRRIA